VLVQAFERPPRRRGVAGLDHDGFAIPAGRVLIGPGADDAMQTVTSVAAEVEISGLQRTEHVVLIGVEDRRGDGGLGGHLSADPPHPRRQRRERMRQVAQPAIPAARDVKRGRGDHEGAVGLDLDPVHRGGLGERLVEHEVVMEPERARLDEGLSQGSTKSRASSSATVSQPPFRGSISSTASWEIVPVMIPTFASGHSVHQARISSAVARWISYGFHSIRGCLPVLRPQCGPFQQEHPWGVGVCNGTTE